MKTFKIYTSGNMLKIDYSVDAVLGQKLQSKLISNEIIKDFIFKTTY